MGLEVPNRKLSKHQIELNTFKSKYSNLCLPDSFSLEEFKELDEFVGVRGGFVKTPYQRMDITKKGRI